MLCGFLKIRNALKGFFLACYANLAAPTRTEAQEKSRTMDAMGMVVREVQPAYLLSTPPSKEALRHSGGESRLWTSATVTLYFDVELRRESLPGTEQNTSLGFMTTPINPSFWQGRLRALFFVREMGPAGGRGKPGYFIKGKNK